jgi:hypothetical protein
MEIRLSKTHGLRNDLLIVLRKSEIENAFLHIANRDRFMKLRGLLRHVPEQDPDERRQVNECKVAVEEHLRALSDGGRQLLSADGKPKRRIVVIGSRNVGNNHGFVAWQKDENPKFFHVRGDPLNYPSYSCLTRFQDGHLEVLALRFEKDRVFEGNREVTDSITWCVYANQVLRDGKVVNIEEIIDQFYDNRHILAFDRSSQKGLEIETMIYEGYPGRFRANALKAWRDLGVPRNRFLHNCLGLSDDSVFILQREGTIEEVAHALQLAGARDGLILDNGGSVFCWTWWIYPDGGFLFTAPDFRPNGSAVLAFVLNGPANNDLPSGSVSFSIL